MAGKWLTPWDQVLCPFCFKSFHLGDAHLRPLDGVSSDMVADDIMQKHVGTLGGESPVLPRCIVPPSRDSDFARYLWNRLRLDNSVMVDHDRVCPHCHCPMPIAVAKGELKSNVIAIIGEKASGKSNFFAALIHELQRGASMEGSGVVLLQQSTINPTTFRKTLSHELWKQRYGRFILGEKFDGQNRRAVPESHSRDQNPDVRTPLIYRLQFGEKHRPMAHKVTNPGASFRCLDLVIYDTAGEDMEDGKWMRFLAKAQGLVFLIDPHTFPALNSKLSRTGRQSDPAANGTANGQHNAVSHAGIVIERVLEEFQRNSVVSAEQAVAKPTAFVLTKSDILKPPVIGTDSRIHSEAMHNDGVDLDDLRRVSKEVKDLLVNSKEDGLLRQTNLFEHSIFCAVSALGEEPIQKGEDFEITRLRPTRVLDPLMWMLTNWATWWRATSSAREVSHAPVLLRKLRDEFRLAVWPTRVWHTGQFAGGDCDRSQCARAGVLSGEDADFGNRLARAAGATGLDEGEAVRIGGRSSVSLGLHWRRGRRSLGEFFLSRTLECFA